ncbi:MAG: ATP-binding protein [Ignavibacteriaceae bacterium]
MSSVINQSIFDYIYKGEAVFSAKEYAQVRKETKSLLVTPLKVLSLLIAVSGLFAMIFEVRYFSEFSFQVYLTRLMATLIAFFVLVLMYSKFGTEKPVILVHVLLAVMIISSGYMILLIPTTLVLNTQIVGLMIFTSALFLSWDVKNQIIVAIYYNLVFATAILINNKNIYFLPHMYEMVIFVLFLSIISVIGSAVNFKLRMQLAERSFLVELSGQKFHSIFENSAEGMFQSSLDGKFLTVNSALVKILGYDSREELLKIDIPRELYKSPEEREKLIEYLKKNGSVNNYVLTFKKKNGSDVIVRLNDHLVPDDNSDHYYFEGNMQDITDQFIADEKRRKIEEELRAEKIKSDRLAREATQSTNIKSQFLANMSHEIRTPMNGILGFLSLIEKGVYKDREELKQFTYNARQSAELLLEIINDILDLSKIESGKMVLESTDFNLNDILEESILLLSSKINEKDLKVTTDIYKNSDVFLIGDPTRLRQIFLNLLSNAIKFTEKGEIKIIVSTEKIDNENLILHAAVKDQGIGIPRENLGELFKPFTQLDGSHTRKYGGTGLGLVICKEFITMMGGNISVESEKGIGSSFYFTAKLKKQKYIAVPSITGRSKTDTKEIVLNTNQIDLIKKERSRYKILLAEDNLINQKVALRILSDCGYNVTPVNNGIEVLKILDEKSFDIILMDVQMPEMDGFTATSKIRKSDTASTNIPIIALTAHALIGDKDKCIEAGMNDYVSKPIVPEKFVKVIDKWLNIEIKRGDTGTGSVQGKYEEVFDFAVLDKMSLGDKEFQVELLGHYRKDLDKRFNRLMEFIQSQNLPKIAAEAHTIKGASFSVGANKIGNIAYSIELTGRQKDLENVNQWMDKLSLAIKETKMVLEKYLS